MCFVVYINKSYSTDYKKAGFMVKYSDYMAVYQLQLHIHMLCTLHVLTSSGESTGKMERFIITIVLCKAACNTMMYEIIHVQ